jgi:hypothetical protein
MTEKNPKYTRTTRYFTGTATSRGFDGTRSVPGWVLEHPTFIPRLNWKVSPKVHYDSEKLCESVAAAPDDALFFCDTSIFDVRTDDRLWPALTNRSGKLVLTPRVRIELEPWLKMHSDHIAARAVQSRDIGIRFLEYDRSVEALTAYSYYMNLLGLRKRLAKLQEIRFERTHGRLPDEQEAIALKAETQRLWGERGAFLAKKGDRPITETFYTDEEVVYLAVATGLISGRPTIILTKDEDLQEQFYRLIWLIDTHYRGMLLANLYAREFSQFKAHPMPMLHEEVRDSFEGMNNTLIERSDRLIEEGILPSRFQFVPLECWVVGTKLTRAIFGAEREMGRVLHVKGLTNGLNTDLLGDRNCHVWLAPLNIPESLRGCAAIAQDRRLQVRSSSVQIPILDVNQAIFCGERFKHLVQGSDSETSGLSSAGLLGLTLPRDYPSK